MSDTAGRRMRMGMVGGGLGSFIGPIHRMGAELDGGIELVAGAFSRNPEKSRESGRMYGIDPERSYPSFETMMEAERKRKDPIDFVAIVTPNSTHYPAAAAALRHGFHVISDKPATAHLKEAIELKSLVAESGLLYALTHTYTGYVMVREARRIVAAGELGEIRKVVVNYPQGWLAAVADPQASEHTAWRVDPNRSGTGGAISDIGTHCFNLLEYVSGRRVAEIGASLSSTGGRPLDDDCNVLLKLDNGAPGVIIASQISTGERNSIALDVYGENCGLHWTHSDPERLELGWRGRPLEVRYAGAKYLPASTLAISRMPSGHPEGVIEAFANIYRDFATAVRARLTDARASLSSEVPGIEDAVREMEFVERAVQSSQNHSRWVNIETSNLEKE